MSKLIVSESDLHAFVDGALPVARRAEVETYLAGHPEDAERVAAYRQQNATLHSLYDPVLDETVPERIAARPARGASLLRYAAVVGWIALGGVIGWHLQAYNTGVPSEPARWARQAAIAHVTYSPEVRHPVEVPAEQETHLVNWLSKRLGTPVKVPHLGTIGYSLVGGRLLPSDSGPVAQFMYQDAKGQRLTLYLRTNRDDTRETAFRFAQENNVGVFYWIDRNLGYALSGEVDKQELLRVATTVYRQLNP
ncbi:MAG: anti-sigma factor [Betaproteobacteria bacterium]|nr:anti-sigma factor [Betaproteobacteria bacterium]